MEAPIERIDPAALACSLEEYWSQRILGEANGSMFKVAKGIGSTNWHAHADQDEVFIVLEGELVVQLRGRDIRLTAGDMCIVPRGVEHCPRADAEVHLLLVGRDITSNEAGGKPAWSYPQGG